MSKKKIGVLALQGDFHKHIEMLNAIGAIGHEIRTSEELHRCEGLIIPGGESTTMFRLLKESTLGNSIQKFAETKPVYGTCAGLILIAGNLVDEGRVIPMKLIDIDVARNAFGRQVDSFSTDVELKLGKKRKNFEAIFIRAPRIQRAGEDVEVLAKWDEEPILVRQGNILGSTFHPELTQDGAVHQYFLEMISEINC